MTPFVKICGVTRADDAALAVSLGASHIGVVRVAASPRSVSAEKAREVFDAAGDVEKVLVYRHVSVTRAIRDARLSGATGIQLYDASPDDVHAVASEGFRLVRVYRMEEDATELPRFEPVPSEDRPALLDVGGGGSGRRFDWTLLGDHAPHATFIAGGIRPENVRALKAYRPYGIDLASGVESAPGVKDPSRLRALFEEVRTW